MMFSLLFLLVTCICLLEAFLIESWGWLMLWPGLCFLGVSVAYATGNAHLFGKRADGSLPLWAVVLYLPYLLPTWLLWQLLRASSREPACQQIIPGLWLARRLLPAEVPVSTTLLVDLTAEFSSSGKLRSDRDYVTLPILDGYVPSTEDLRSLVERIALSSGEVVVHCASGHGRSAMVVACVLIAKGMAHDVAEAENMIKTIRPRIGLSQAQRQRVEEFSRKRC